LGEGGFGRVYLAHDDQLNRPVAIKVPHGRLVAEAGDAEVYLAEARTVASLDHPNVVPVYDVGGNDEFPCYIVSKYIDGSSLKAKTQTARLSLEACAELVATIAEALHYAHKHGIVHRDVKPGNILLDRSDRPFVADFGLALREQDIGTGPRYAGTPTYMSPEQARSEGHRVDGRSDIFSLGTVFYELLTARRPFQAESRSELLEQITNVEVRPPRQIDDRIPKELERICLKALAKRASERYTAAKDMADDLRHFLTEASAEDRSTITGRPRSEAETATPLPSPVPTPSDSRALKVVPKGLRSFDATDADFFLELLPGPRDRDGLPDSIRFWKTRIETTAADGTFSVGLIYGPSGCGKSSLVKAGLVPRLSKSVAAVYVEATAGDTEARLLKALRRRVPGLPDHFGVVESLAALRQGRFLESGRKVLLVLDQFEQWLHAKKSEENTELVQALRQCDGDRVQCVVLVRDDFWLAVSRFMQVLEVRVLEGENSRLVDLFDPRHARKVLAAFGRAFSALPEHEKDLSKDQDAFLDRAVSGLAQDGKIISVRLALFAEMVKGKPWTPATLKEVGGAEGVGVTFLEETYCASTAPPAHRLHQKAAQAVLKSLLPEAGSDIKGHLRSRQELLQASGYASRPKEFDELLRILDAELRLITPTDPAGVEDTQARSASEGDAKASPPLRAHEGTRYYQLTHDYLVPSLRDWLTRKQRETWRGRAELRLADRAALWTARPENRHLPAFWEWADVRLFTRRGDWTFSQQRMMRTAARYHALRGFLLAACVVLFAVLGREGYGMLKAQALRDRLLSANTGDVPLIVFEMKPYRRWIDPLLKEQPDDAKWIPVESPVARRRALNISLALLPVEPSQLEYLYGRLLSAEQPELTLIKVVLSEHKQDLIPRLWAVVERPPKEQDRQWFCAAYALASYDPDSERWERISPTVVEHLLSVDARYLGLWMDGFQDVNSRLLTPLGSAFRDRKEQRATERMTATTILAYYVAEQPEVLADLLLDADERQFGVLYRKFKVHGKRDPTLLTSEVDRKLPPDAPQDAKEKLAKRQANAAVALLRLNRAEMVWPLLKHSPDPRVRSYLIHRLAPFGVDVGTIIKRLGEEPDVTIRRALVLSLGEFGEDALPSAERAALVKKMQELYRTADDAGLHAAAEWLLRHWKEDRWLKQVDAECANDQEQREKKIERIKHELQQASRIASAPGAKPQWYVNGQGQTMVVIPGPVQFMMGSLATEQGRQPFETQHKRRIGRTFALAAKPVTVEQYRKFDARYAIGGIERWARTGDSPVIATNWFQAAAYCNWLSKQEGLPPSEWCYEPVADAKALAALAASSVGLLAGSDGPLPALGGLFPGRAEPRYASGMKLARNYLQRRGYRLPTEAEMEYATRAGAVTARYYGETEELMPNYAWYLKNSQDRTWPVGSRKPNDVGLFDVQGNAFTWCQESFKSYSRATGEMPIDDTEDILSISSTAPRVLRGGSFYIQASLVRSALRTWIVPADRSNTVGFRPARTFAP
jgi:serine/threonine protein kinase/formylglycine-generating enzyme required for sulfatase activity